MNHTQAPSKPRHPKKREVLAAPVPTIAVNVSTEMNEETAEKHQYVSEATAVLSQVNTVSNEDSNRVVIVEEQNNSRKISSGIEESSVSATSVIQKFESECAAFSSSSSSLSSKVSMEVNNCGKQSAVKG